MWRSPFLDWMFRRVTKAGTAKVLVPVGIVVLLWQRTQRRMLWFLGLCSLGVIVLERSAKLMIARPRPIHYLASGPLLHSSHGFPSGHVLAATAFYGMVVILLQKASIPRGQRRAIIGFLMFVTLLVGVSRLYLGAHWLSDVVGGYALGGGYCALATAVYLRGERRLAASPTQPHTEYVR